MSRLEASRQRILTAKRKHSLERTLPFIIKYAKKRHIPVLDVLALEKSNLPNNLPCFLEASFLILSHENVGKGSLALVAGCTICDRRLIDGIITQRDNYLEEINWFNPDRNRLCRYSRTYLIPFPTKLKHTPAIFGTSSDIKDSILDRLLNIQIQKELEWISHEDLVLKRRAEILQAPQPTQFFATNDTINGTWTFGTATTHIETLPEDVWLIDDPGR